MKIGITLTPYMAEGESAEQSIEELLWVVRYADANDFDIVWTTEHHFQKFSFSGAPSVLLAQFAAITERIRIGYAVAILPLHHPLRLAEEMTWIDQFSNGRLIAGASPGWAAYEFDALGVDIAERHGRFEEGMRLLRKAVEGEKFSHTGTFWNVADIQVFPPPHQAGGPRFVVATSSVKGIENAARMRVSPVLGFESDAIIADLRTRYIATAREHGVNEAELADLLSYMGGLRRLIVCDTDDEAEAEAIAAAERFGKTAQTLLTDSSGKMVEGILRRRPDEDVAARDSYAFGGTVWGSPDTVVRKLLALKALGLGHVVLQFHTATRKRDGTRENIRRFAQDVLPAYRAELEKIDRLEHRNLGACV